jgi:predicted MFS family arabinose efflux permease
VTATDERSVLLGTAVLGNFAQFGARVVISPFVIAITGTFLVSKSDVGLVLTLLWATFAIVQYPSGVLADRYGERPVILASLATTAAGSLALASAPSYFLFVAAAVLLGGGAGLYFSVGTALLSKQYEAGDGQGRALSIHSAGAPLAGLVVPVAATTVAAQWGWRAGVATGAAVSAVALVGVLVAVGPTPASDPTLDVAAALHPHRALALLRQPGFAFTAAVATIGMYAFQSIVSFLPTFLREYHEFDPAAASTAFGGMFVLMAIGLPVAGRVADRRGTHVGIAGPMLLTAASLAVVLAAPARLFVSFGVAGVGLGITWGGALQSQFMLGLDAAERGTGFGLARSVFVLFGAVGNVATGTLADRVGWVPAYGVVGCLLVGAAVAVLVGRGRASEP